MDIIGNSQVLNGALGDGAIANGGQGVVIGLCIKSALTGSLTITGVSQAGGAAQSWVVAPGTSGYVAPPGSTKYWGMLQYTLSNPGADAGKAFIATQPT